MTGNTIVRAFSNSFHFKRLLDSLVQDHDYIDILYKVNKQSFKAHLSPKAHTHIKSAQKTNQSL